MNPLLLANHMILLAGGIDGNKHLDNSERWGITLVGLGIVIAALALLVVIIFLFGKIFESINAKQKAKETAIAEQKKPKNSPAPVKKAPAPAVAKQNPVNSGNATAPGSVDDEEVIAVISAVVAMMSQQDGKTYKVKSVKAVPKNQSFSGRSAWAMDGRRQNVSPF
ncbi:MAG: OadG family protein [Oscillospiraceae bacterium]|nr:OadG family protein [Oscillospiraceae bacterium]MDE5884066.1 OadG family protein [Oscillospiraceae bacterium]